MFHNAQPIGPSEGSSALREVRFAGFQGTTLIDFPRRIASIFFVPGCDLRCPYCHNGALFSVRDADHMPPDMVWAELDKRRGFIDGIVLTGGEPSLHPGLVVFARIVKERYPFEVKLDTNGLNGDFLRDMLPFLDHVAIDLKTTPERYALLGSSLSPEEVHGRLVRTRELLASFPGEVEYRTTMYPPIVGDIETLRAMMVFVPPNADLYLQRFMPDHAWSEEARAVTSFEPADIETLAMELRRSTGRDRIFVRTYA
ncbi:MAG TPA: radical SAM protein [bacterium]|nr:radical SAM protein [bacterium]